MNHIKIVNWMMQIEDELFEEMKTVLLEKYISFSIMDNDKLNKEIICEKLCDQIEKTMINTKKSFDDLVNYYMDSLGDLVEAFLPQVVVGKNSKGKEILGDSRALTYFKQAKNRKNDKNHPLIGLEDYSRIMFCLYGSIIKHKRQQIINFDFSFDWIKCQTIINSLEAERVKENKLIKIKPEKIYKRFNVSDKYSSDSFVLIMSIMMLYHLKNKEVRGEY